LKRWNGLYWVKAYECITANERPEMSRRVIGVERLDRSGGRASIEKGGLLPWPNHWAVHNPFKAADPGGGCARATMAMWRILAIPIVVFLAGNAEAQETVALKPGAGRDVVETYCNTCHSLDYVRINAPFLNRQGWETEVNKMITAFGAPIGPTDAKIIVDYLVTNYGTGN
jgi:hypothetical protein